MKSAEAMAEIVTAGIHFDVQGTCQINKASSAATIAIPVQNQTRRLYCHLKKMSKLNTGMQLNIGRAIFSLPK